MQLRQCHRSQVGPKRLCQAKMCWSSALPAQPLQSNLCWPQDRDVGLALLLRVLDLVELLLVVQPGVAELRAQEPSLLELLAEPSSPLQLGCKQGFSSVFFVGGWCFCLMFWCWASLVGWQAFGAGAGPARRGGIAPLTDLMGTQDTMQNPSVYLLSEEIAKRAFDDPQFDDTCFQISIAWERMAARRPGGRSAEHKHNEVVDYVKHYLSQKWATTHQS